MVEVIIGVGIFILVVVVVVVLDRIFPPQPSPRQRKGTYQLPLFRYALYDMPHMFPAQNCIVTFEVVELERSSNGSMSRVEYGKGWGASREAINHARCSLAPLWVSTNQVQWLTEPEKENEERDKNEKNIGHLSN